jgi:CubicO group peptidase (beta-lactamase class C family)
MGSPAFDAAAALARRQVEDGAVPFAIVGTAGAAGVHGVEAFGQLGGARVRTRAVCLLASVTKPIVATALMRLAQDGRFPLAAPLSRWFPELDDAGLAPFTAWHVLTHTSGLGDVGLLDLLLRGTGRAELIRRTIELGQADAPGSRFRYASFPWDVLAAAVELALDRPLEAVLEETVTGPLGMADTTFDHLRSGDRRAPIQLGNWDGTLQQLPPGVDPERVVAAYAGLQLAGGGLWSTAADLLRFGRAMLRGGELDGTRILGRPLVDLMTREITLGGLGASGDRLLDDHYAVGWGKPGPAMPGSPAAFFHGGVSGTRLWIDPAEDLVLVYLTGRWGGAGEAIDDVVYAAYGALA